MIVLHIIVRGRVQGVGFRWFVRERARELGLGGWIRNNPDGSVEVVASGPDESLTRFLEEVRRGPPGARVSRLDEVPTAPTPAVTDSFQIVR